LTSPLRVAVIGCGLIAERSHLPVIVSSKRARVAVLVDQDLARAGELRDAFDLSCEATASFRELAGAVDAAVVAVPNSLHAEVSSALLEQGIHVLCEKPLALRFHEGERLCELAEKTRVVLAVGFTSRFHETTELMKIVVEQGLIGDIQSYDLSFGVDFAWATVSGFYFRRELSGGGVLMNEAIHTLDRLLHWFGDVESLECAHNDAGGVETEARLLLRHRQGSARVLGTARFSWLCELRNTLEVSGSAGRAVVRPQNRGMVALHRRVGDQELVFDLRKPGPGDRPPLEYFALQFEDFLDAITTGRPPRVGGREGMRSVALVEEAYRLATPLRARWSEAPS